MSRHGHPYSNPNLKKMPPPHTHSPSTYLEKQVKMHQRLQKSHFLYAATFATSLLLGALISITWRFKVLGKLGSFKG
jgi:hypothetical protein